MVESATGLPLVHRAYEVTQLTPNQEDVFHGEILTGSWCALGGAFSARSFLGGWQGLELLISETWMIQLINEALGP